MFSIQLIALRRVGSSAKTLFNGANIGVKMGTEQRRLVNGSVAVEFSITLD